MYDIKHKESNWVLFLEESFGKNTYDTLLMFNNNANNIKRMIELYWNILNLDDILKNNKEISDKELSYNSLIKESIESSPITNIRISNSKT
jgi:hypothetical protein